MTRKLTPEESEESGMKARVLAGMSLSALSALNSVSRLRTFLYSGVTGRRGRTDSFTQEKEDLTNSETGVQDGNTRVGNCLFCHRAG